MNFNHAGILTLLWLLPILALLLRWTARSEQKRRELFLHSVMAERLFPAVSAVRNFWRGVLLLLAIGLFITAWAGPRFGVYFEKVSRKGADILVLLDTSRSMIAEDLSPNRLEAAKLDIEDLLAAVTGDRVGLIAFAGKPVLEVPLTDDFGFYRQQLKKIDTYAAPKGGTAIGDAVRLALRSMPPDASRDQAILLISDGEDHESMPKEAALDAAGRNVRIFTVALGDRTEGARIPIFDNKGNRTGYEQYNGQEVWSKADEALLTEMAQTTGGVFLAAGTGPCDLGAFYKGALDSLNRSGYGESEKRQLREKYQLFLAAGLIAFVLWLVIPASREAAVEAELEKSPAAVSKNASRLKRWRMRFFPIIFLIFGSGILWGEEPAPLTAEGNTNQPPQAELVMPESKAASDTADTAANAEEPAAEPAAVPESKNKEEKSARALYDKGCRLMQESGKEAEAEALFEEVLRAPDHQKTAPKAAYNLALLKAGTLQGEAEKASNIEPAQKEAPVNTGMPVMGQNPQAPTDPVEEYRKQSAEREKVRQPIREKARLVEDLFEEAIASGDKKLQRDAAENLDILRNWQYGQDQRWQDAERTARLGQLKPAEHLNWLQQETEQQLNEGTFQKDPASAADYQRLFDAARTMQTLSGDASALAEHAVFDQPNNEGKIPSAKNRETLAQVQSALADGESAAKQFQRLPVRDALRSAAEGIDTVRNDLLDYRGLLTESMTRQEEIAQEAEQNAAANDEAEQDRIDWSDNFVGRKVQRMMDQANEEFAARPWSDEEELTEPQNPEKQEEPNTPDPEEEQKKVRRSMKKALDLGPEIVTMTEDASGDAEAVHQRENRILEQLREIQKPLQDENQQNQDQNQDQNKDQNQQNQNQNSDQNQDQNKDQNQENNSDQQEPKPQESQPQEQKPQDQPKESDQKPEDADQRDAEALMRKVRQRQQNAEEMRRLRDEYLRRSEKPEKDW